MVDQKEKLDALLRDTPRLRKLLLLEKTRRRVSENDLLFLGTENIAQYYWCAMQSHLRSKGDELKFFAAYLQDRIRYALDLGLIAEVPVGDDTLLKIGDEITTEQIDQLLKNLAERFTGRQIRKDDALTTIDADGNQVMVINPGLSQEERASYEEMAKAKDMRIASPNEFPMQTGSLLESTNAEQYPSIRWHFKWGRYIVIGVPDGITDKFVYEYKTTGTDFLIKFTKPVAFTQADLYGYFFHREEKRVQVLVKDTQETKTWQEPVNMGRVEQTLVAFTQMDDGVLPLPPKDWKCKKCEFLKTCPITPLAAI